MGHGTRLEESTIEGGCKKRDVAGGTHSGVKAATMTLEVRGALRITGEFWEWLTNGRTPASLDTRRWEM